MNSQEAEDLAKYLAKNALDKLDRDTFNKIDYIKVEGCRVSIACHSLVVPFLLETEVWWTEEQGLGTELKVVRDKEGGAVIEIGGGGGLTEQNLVL